MDDMWHNILGEIIEFDFTLCSTIHMIWYENVWNRKIDTYK